MKHPTIMLFFTLCAVLMMGALTGITTPQKVAAKEALHHAEHTGDVLFHSPHLGANGLACDTCHVDGGRFSHRWGPRRIPSLVGAKTLFPKATTQDQVRTLEAQINLCIVHELKGRALPASSRKLALLDLYIRHLSRFHER